MNKHPRVFISYSHDSAQHRAKVRALCNRLRAEGVDCHIDQYVEAPPEGWPMWMLRQIRDADFVLVVCTETYRRRLEGLEETGRGLGATWEGGIVTIELYQAQGRNTKFIPVVLTAADAEHIPVFLKGATYYHLDGEEAYDALYARLTGQAQAQAPPLGTRRVVDRSSRDVDAGRPPGTTPQPLPRPSQLLVLLAADHHVALFPALRVDEGEVVTCVLLPDNPEDQVFLEDLRRRPNPQVSVAYRTTAHIAVVRSLTRTHEGEKEQWVAELAPANTEYGVGTEMGTSGHSADDIAELRARRILLDERPPAELQRWGKVDPMVEMLVEGIGTALQVTESPFPKLFEQFGDQPALFLAAAKLFAVLQLRLSGAVEHILQLDLELLGTSELRVRFRGRRRKFYTNVAAHQFTIDGTCPLV